MSGVAAIAVEGLSKYYGDVRGVEDITLRIREGEIFGFLGPNGAGKSTLIRVLMGFLKPTAGSARMLGYEVTDREQLIAAKRDIGHIPGDFHFYEQLTGETVLDYYAAFRGDDRREELLDLFSVPLDRKVGAYSRGNLQKLAIVQAFMHDPRLVIMDEPTSGLDPLAQNTLYEFLEAEQERGVTTFFSSHILSEVRRICDRVGIIRQGQLVALEDIHELLAKSGKVVHVDLAESVDPDAFAFDGIIDANASNGHLKLVISGNYDRLVDELAPYTIEDLEVRETSLEDVFMHFYGESNA